MFIKFLGAVIIVASGTMCGIYASKSIEKKVKFLEQYIIFLTQTKTMISYNAVSIIEIFSKINSVPLIKPLLELCIENISKNMSFETAWHKAVNKMYERKFFSVSEKSLMYSFGETFGSGGIDEEITKTELHLSLMNERLNIARNEFLSKNKLYRIVGMFSGIMIALIII